MSKQRPDPDKLANELLGASAFFRQKPEPPVETRAEPAAKAIPVEATLDPTPVSDVTTSRRQSVTTSPHSAPPTEGFDINRETASRDSLRLSVDETKALDALRSALKWDHDLTVSKNDICRVALHALLEDFAAKGDKSQVLARLKPKRSGR